MSEIERGPSLRDCKELIDALQPFLYAASVGWCVEQDAADAKPRPLIAFAGYAGQYAAQSRVSWRDWKDLLSAADRVGLLPASARGWRSWRGPRP